MGPISASARLGSLAAFSAWLTIATAHSFAQETAADAGRNPKTPSGESSVRSHPVGEDLHERIAILVDNLGSASFKEREAATAELLSIGQPALEHLSSLRANDLEARRRVASVLDRIESRRFDVLARDFLLDPDPSNSYGFPAWKPFSEFVGHSRISKLLFLEMLRLHPDLVQVIDRVAGAESPNAADYRNLKRSAAEISARLVNEQMHQLQRPEIGDFTTILFAVSVMPDLAPVEVNNLIEMNANSVPITTHLRKRGYGVVIRRMLAAWVPKTHPSMADTTLQTSLALGLETGAIIARQNLSANLDVNTRQQAIHCLARFGTTEDIDLLIAFLDDDTIVREFTLHQLAGSFPFNIRESNEPPPGFIPDDRDANLDQVAVVRINDLALAAICMLSADVEPESVFPDFQRNEILGFEKRSIAVPKNPDAQMQRNELIEQWRKRLTPTAG